MNGDYWVGWDSAEQVPLTRINKGIFFLQKCLLEFWSERRRPIKILFSEFD